MVVLLFGNQEPAIELVLHFGLEFFGILLLGQCETDGILADYRLIRDIGDIVQVFALHCTLVIVVLYGRFSHYFRAGPMGILDQLGELLGGDCRLNILEFVIQLITNTQLGFTELLSKGYREYKFYYFMYKLNKYSPGSDYILYIQRIR